MSLKNNKLSIREVFNLFEQGEIPVGKVFRLIEEDQTEEKINRGQQQENKVEEVVEQLDKLIGLEKIKNLVDELRAFVKIQEERKKRNLKSDPLALHMIFKGNPGTGKTTVARIFGQLFKELGLLETGNLNEVERADLVGEYIGHTAQKTKKVIKKTLGNILFVDEAYALARGGNRDFGKEAIDTLVKAMEDNRDNLIVILAGYPKEMDYFLQSNPGLKSRFPIQIEFEDYSLTELIEIAHLVAQEREYILSKQAEAKLYSILSKIRQESGPEKGNARTVRNIIEKTIRRQAVRLVNQSKINKQDLMTITKDDLKEVITER